jgi:hypothetical protein
MKRLIFSAIGVILTFACIIYTAPPVQESNKAGHPEKIKAISKPESNATIKQPDYQKFMPDTGSARRNLVVKMASSFIPDTKE